MVATKQDNTCPRYDINPCFKCQWRGFRVTLSQLKCAILYMVFPLRVTFIFNAAAAQPVVVLQVLHFNFQLLVDVLRCVGQSGKCWFSR
jgi:hypothetical protein